MANPRPSCTLILDVDESLATETTRLEVKRCYTYVGSTVLRTHPDGEKPNTVHLLAKLGNRHYLHSSDEGADELWETSIEHWFDNMFYNVCNNMRIYNRRQREIGNDELRFEVLDCELENGALNIALHLDSTCSVPPEKAALLTAVRTAYNDGTLGSDVVAVSMPTAASWQAQVVAGEAAKAEREKAQAEAKKAEEEAAKQAKQAAEKEAEDAFLESPALVEEEREEEHEEEVREEYEKTGIKPPKRIEFEEEVPDFEVDYRMWDIEYADGTHKTFDSEAMAFVDEEASA